MHYIITLRIIFSIAPSCVNINVTTTLNLNNNPAYEPQTPLQKNLAYEDTTLNISKPEEFQALSNTPEPTYEIIPLTSSQPASTTTHMFGSRKEDEYDKLNRDIAQHTQRNIISQ